MVDFGSTATRYKNHKYVHSFVPFAYLFVRTESEHAYRSLFEIVVRYAALYFGLQFVPSVGCIDRSPAIASALVHIWPKIQVITCWPHVCRNSKKKGPRLHDSEFYRDVIVTHLHSLHLARSEAQHKLISDVYLAHWKKSGEMEYAKWFEDTYCSSPWNRWFITASNIPGNLMQLCNSR